MKHEDGLTAEQALHLKDIKRDFDELVTKKYTAGAIEHGGKLWTKTGLIDMALEEVVDLAVYLLTLKEQILDYGVELGNTQDEN